MTVSKESLAAIGAAALDKAERKNREVFEAYKKLPGNENATGASSLNGGNKYGNTYGHALNFFATYSGKEEAPVYRSMSMSAELPEQFKRFDFFFEGVDDEKKRYIHSRLTEMNKDEYFENAALGLLINEGVLV